MHVSVYEKGDVSRLRSGTKSSAKRGLSPCLAGLK